MNIVQKHLRIRQYLDTVGSPRFDSSMVDREINTAINQIVNDRYMPLDPKRRENSFQVTQRIRDELYTLIRTSLPLTPVNNVLLLASVEGYRFLLACQVRISSIDYPTDPLTYDEWLTIDRDPFKYPTLTYPSRIYRIENSNGIEIKFGNVGTLTSGTITYLRDPNIVSYGTKKTSGSLSVGYNYIATKTTVINYNSSVYQTLLEGDLFLCPGPGYSIGSGEVVYGFENCDLPINLHEEVCVMAAEFLLKSARKLLAGSGGNN